jgi:single-stranded-DNA-specific exonuclease
MLDALSPYGIGHTRPLFVVEKVRVVQASTVGADGKHLRLTISDGSATARCIGFRHGARLDDSRPGQHIDAVVEASWNDWQGRREPQLKIIDFRTAQ